MANSLSDILADKWDEPPEIQAIKDYVRQKFHTEVAVAIRERHITISVPSAALAGTLRMQLHELQKTLTTDKRLVIRIGK